MNKIALIFLSFIMIVICSGSATACWCRRDVQDTEAKVKRAIRQDLHDSTVVFSGEVLEKSATGLKFKVHTVWKGKIADEIIFTSQNYLPEVAGHDVEHFIWDCAYPFEVGQTYLVYAQMERGQLEVSKCSRTQPLKESARDVVELDRFTAGKRKAGRHVGVTRGLLRRNPTSACS